MITKAKDVLYDLEKAIHLAKSGRPGPCWLDIPLDIQAAMVDIKKMKRYIPPRVIENKNQFDGITVDSTSGIFYRTNKLKLEAQGFGLQMTSFVIKKDKLAFLNDVNKEISFSDNLGGTNEELNDTSNEIVMQIFPNMALVLSLVTLVLLVARTKLVAQVA